MGFASAIAGVGLANSSELIALAAKTYTVGKKNEVPVRGGKIFRVGGKSIFITQPKAGVFRAFDAICTHAGGQVNTVVGTNMVCALHGAKFDFSSGQPVGGPAPKSLRKIKVTISGNDLKVTI